MTTANGLVQHAVRRDLERTRILLSTQLHISRERREALAHHLLWLLELVAADEEEMALARAHVDRTAREFFASAERIPRRNLLYTVSELARLQAERDDWLRLGDRSMLARQVHWLVDGLEARAGDRILRLLAPRRVLTPVKLRAEVYRYRKDLLWGGTPAYALTSRTGAGR